MFRRILLPSAFRRALPAYGDEVIFMLVAVPSQASSPSSISGAARTVNSRYYTA